MKKVIVLGLLGAFLLTGMPVNSFARSTTTVQDQKQEKKHKKHKKTKTSKHKKEVGK